MEIISITAALAGIKNAADIAKIIKDSGASLEQAEIKLQLADLISALADSKIEIANIREAMSEREAEIINLTKKLEIKDNLEWEEPYYFLQTQDQKDGPYCQKCYDSKMLLIRLQGDGKGWWECNECKNNYTDKNYDDGADSLTITPSNEYF